VFAVLTTESTLPGRHVCFWHKADIPPRSADVCFRGNSGRYAMRERQDARQDDAAGTSTVVCMFSTLSYTDT
jgi:hypothetical protein